MIIYVSNLTTASNSLTIPFEPTEDISNRVCELKVDQYYVNTTNPFEIQCNLTQVYSVAFNNSKTQNGTNTIIAQQTDGAVNLNGSWDNAPRYVNINGGTQDLTFSILRYTNGDEDRPNLIFAFLISIIPAPDRIPATLFATSYTFPLTMMYDPPFHLAGKEVWLQVDHTFTASFALNRRFVIRQLTQIHSNDNKVVHVRENRNLYRDIPIKVYLPHGPFELILDSLDEPITVPFGTLTTNTTTLNTWTWTYASSTAADVNAYKAFTSAGWTSGENYTLTNTRWPPSAMSTSTQVIGSTTYTASGSPGDVNISNVFDHNQTTSWFPTLNQYSGGNYIGTDSTLVSGVAVPGTWVQLYSSTAFFLSSYTYRGALAPTSPETRLPKDFVLAGSNDGIIWYQLDKRTNILVTDYTADIGSKYITPSITTSTVSYKYYRFIINKNNGSSNTSFHELELYGLQDPNYTGTTTTGGVLGEYVEVTLPWTGFNVDSWSFTSTTVRSHKLMRQLSDTGNWEEVIPGSSGKGTRNQTKYRLVFTSSVGATAVTVNDVKLTGTYNATPRVLFTFKEV